MREGILISYSSINYWSFDRIRDMKRQNAKKAVSTIKKYGVVGTHDAQAYIASAYKTLLRTIDRWILYKGI